MVAAGACRTGIAAGACRAVIAAGACRAVIAAGACRAGIAAGACRAVIAAGACRAVIAAGACRAGIAAGACRAGISAGACRAGIAARKRLFALHPIKNGVHRSFYQPCKIHLAFHRQLSASQLAILSALIHVPAALNLKEARAVFQRVVVQHVQRVLAGVYSGVAAGRPVLVVGLAHLVLLATALHIFVHGLVCDDLLNHEWYPPLCRHPSAAASNRSKSLRSKKL